MLQQGADIRVHAQREGREFVQPDSQELAGLQRLDTREQVGIPLLGQPEGMDGSLQVEICIGHGDVLQEAEARTAEGWVAPFLLARSYVAGREASRALRRGGGPVNDPAAAEGESG